MDCKLDHSEFEYTKIPDELWEKINPTIFEGVGVLCPACIVKRLAEVGEENFNIKDYIV